MANDLAKRFIKKDGSQRISFYREEDAVKYKTTRKCLSGNGEDEEYEETEWEESDSCWSFYGEQDKMIPYMFEEANLKQEEFEEVNV